MGTKITPIRCRIFVIQYLREGENCIVFQTPYSFLIFPGAGNTGDFLYYIILLSGSNTRVCILYLLCLGGVHFL